MEDWQKPHFETLKEYIKKGWVKKETKFEHIEYEGKNPFINEKFINLPIGSMIADGDCCESWVVLWL